MRVFLRHPFARAAILCAAAASFAIARPAVTFNVSFNDPGSAFSDYYDEITSHMNAAGNDWVSRFDLGVDSSLEVLIGFPDIPTGNGRSVTSSFVANIGGINTFE
ncbi:MAG: hypothetical protein H7Y38_11540 [Armatimonadetes bacterium]|nr:hypothetical protein [Armatimonadota bacterium]